MLEQDLKKELEKLAQDARDKGYTIKTPELFVDSVFGSKLAYYSHAGNKIVIHDHYVENGSPEEIEQTVIHELCHAIAEQNNTEKTKTGKIKHVWHGQAWKDVMVAMGGNAERYHTGTYKKPAFKKVSMQELYAIQPTKPADTWERGTYNQWLRRGYHVIKGQKGSLAIWEFVADEYETAEDGKTSNYGRASAVYFTPDQVEPNERKS